MSHREARQTLAKQEAVNWKNIFEYDNPIEMIPFTIDILSLWRNNLESHKSCKKLQMSA